MSPYEVPRPTHALIGVSMREVPNLTLYRDGLANLNGYATELLRTTPGVLLVAPEPTRPGRLSKMWQLHSSPEEEARPLVAHGARVSSRFRQASAARLIFKQVPSSVECLTFVLYPEPGGAGWFHLIPV